MDALGFLPLNDQLELVAAAGVGKYEFDVKLKYSDGIHEFSGSDDNVGYRFGAGAQYNITGHWALRGMVRYVVLDSEYIDDMLEFSLRFNPGTFADKERQNQKNTLPFRRRHIAPVPPRP